MNAQKTPGIITVAEHNSAGFKQVIESEGWAVAIKNYQPLNALKNLGPLKRHMLSDEVFILLEGNCVLMYNQSSGQTGNDIVCKLMEKGKVYCVHKGVWHTTVCSNDVKLIIVEDLNTSAENTEEYQLSQEQIASISKKIKGMSLSV